MSHDSDENTPQLQLTDRTRFRGPLEVDFEEIPSQITDPVEWIAEDMNSAAHDIVRRSGRSAGSSVPYGQFASAVAMANERELRWRRLYKQLVGVANVLLEDLAELREQLEAMAKGRDQLTADVAELKRDIEPVRGLKKRFAGYALTVLGAVGLFLWNRAGDEREAKYRLEQAEKAIERLERADGRRSHVQPTLSVPDFVGSTSRNEP